jgi:hypothetical protein
VIEGIMVNELEVPLLHDVWKVFATEPELEDPIVPIARELLKNQQAPSPCSPKGQISDRLLLLAVRLLCPGIRTSVA